MRFGITVRELFLDLGFFQNSIGLRDFETWGVTFFPTPQISKNILPIQNEIVLSSTPAFDAEPAFADRHLILSQPGLPVGFLQ